MEEFLQRCFYHSGQYNSEENFAELDTKLEQKEDGKLSNRLFYLSIPPNIFVDVVRCASGKASSKNGWTRALFVLWFKSFSSVLDGENGLEAVIISKFAKAFRIPLGAVRCYIVAKFTPVNENGESGEPTYTISDRLVETLPPNLNFLSITGDYSGGGILTASYGYIGGHEEKSIYL